MRRAFGTLVTVVLVSFLSSTATMQSANLRVVSAGPNNELNQLQEANEIRVIFSEPMVPLGRVPADPHPSWIHVTPAIKGSYRWSGTTILILTPDTATPLPASTHYTVTVDASATSDAGHRLDAPFTFAFTTPTVKLTSMRWYRRDDRVDRPLVVVLAFNQRVDPATIALHASFRYERHDWTRPALSADARARMARIDPGSPARFDAKVAAAASAAARTDAVRFRVTTNWDTKQFPATDSLVALESTTVPPPGTSIALTLDTDVTGREGTARPPAVQRSVAALTPVFFAEQFACQSACDPSGYNGLSFSTDVGVAKFAAALSVTDITNATSERPVARSTTVKPVSLDTSSSPNLEDGGYDRQPPARTFAYRLDAVAGRGRRTGARLSMDRHRRELARARVHELRRRPRRVGTGRRPGAALLLTEFP